MTTVMTATGPPQASGTQDPRYHEGMAHLQAGEWQQAIQCLAGLAADYPDDPAIERALEQADFKASLDETTRIRAKRWIFPWRRITVISLILVAIGVLAVQGGRLVQRQVAPALDQLQEEQRLAELEADAMAAFDRGEFVRAESLYQELLTAIPDHEGALQAVRQIAEDREVAGWYDEAVALESKGDYDGALERLTLVLGRNPRYRDAAQRVDDIKLQQDRDNLFAEAEADLEAGRVADAVSKYEQLRDRFAGYNRDVIADHLYEAYMQLGRSLIQQNPPATEGVSQALEYFGAALALQPRSSEPALEQQLAMLYLEGQARYLEGDWDEAIVRLQAVYDRRPGYLNGLVAAMLYEAYIRTGDELRDGSDLYLAYERYRQAAALSVEDTALASGRISQVVAALTPSPTPTPTPTNTPVPPTSTPKPKRKKPKPTSTPVPVVIPTKPATAWSGGVVYVLPNYGVTQLKGFTISRMGNLVGDIWLYYWWEGGAGAWTQSGWNDPGVNTPYAGDEQNWDFLVDGFPKAGVWRVCVVEHHGYKDCISNIVNVATTSTCDPGSGVNVVHITFQQN